MKYKTIAISITNECNINCKMCCLSKNKNISLDIDAISNYIISSKNISSVEAIAFTGGEPFLKMNHLKQLISLSNSVNKKTTVITNGFWASNLKSTIEILSEMKMLGLRTIGISYDEFHAKLIPKKNIIESGLLLTTSFIYGFPEETIEDFDCTVKMIESLFLMDITNIQMHYFNIYSNTLEAEKVIDIMYFDENRLNLSLYEDKSFDDITADLIKKHPILFSHYYTFDSEIRRNYHFFETLVCCISTSSNIFSFCTKYFIRKYGLKKMYKQMEDKIIEVHEVKQYIPVNKINKTSTNYMLCEMFNDYCKKQMETIEDPVLEEIYKYESALFDFALNSGLEYLVYKSPIDIEKTIEDNAIVLNEMYYRFNKDKNEIKVSTLSPTYGLLAKLAKV